MKPTPDSKYLIREAEQDDLPQLLGLLTYLHDSPEPEIDGHIEKIWSQMVNNPNHHIILGFAGDNLISSCVIVIIENLTRGQRPYAVIENVVTHPDYRNKGYGTAILEYAKEKAQEENCYKIMLMTSSKQDSVLDFYRGAGYNSDDKTAFIQWLGF